MGGVKLGKLLGFDITIDWSWLLIFFLVVYTLANGYFPRLYPGFDIATSWLVGVVAALLLFGSVLVHELSHSVVARSHGTPVKGIMLFLFGGMSQTAEEPKSAKEEFWTAIVGPATSLGLGAFFYMIGGIGIILNWPEPLVAICGYVALINFLLGAFNLAPGFPLDGGRVLRSVIWAATNDLTKSTQYASYAGQAVGYGLMAVGFVEILTGGPISGLWLIFIGWFVTGAARTSYQQVLIRQALSGVRVEQVMTTDVPVIPAETSVRKFIDEHLLRHEYSCYPVTSDGHVVGVVGIEEVRSVPSNEWDVTPVGRVAHKVNSEYKISADEDAWNALARLADGNVCRLLVMENDQLKGTIGRDAVFRLVQTKLQLGL
ncbi:MAG: site-2 protease family protein [Armatimonadetes bacterium]|nr:site-2 protease family protein [Armatimonadota bacterium]